MNIPFPIDEDVLSVQFSTSAVSDPRTPMWRAIGLLISNYAKVEILLHIYARRLIGLDEQQSRILLSNLKAHEVTKCIKELLPLSSASTDDIKEFEVLSSQIKDITDARHLIVHNGVTFNSGNEVFTHKKFVSKTTSSYQEDRFSLEQLHAMVDDCGCIATRLTALTDPSIWSFVGEAEEFKAFVFSPWRYLKN